MAIMHCNFTVVGGGRSAVAAAAYRAGVKLHDYKFNKTHDYTKKNHVMYSEILLPANAPHEYADRETLWNSVQNSGSSNRKDAQYARDVEYAIPNELTRDESIELCKIFFLRFANAGMCVDYSIHDKPGNRHVHGLLTMRSIDSHGMWMGKSKTTYKLDESGQRIPLIDKKTGEQKISKAGRRQWKRETVPTNDWDNPNNAEKWREAWAIACNEYLNVDQWIDHRSYERQGRDIIPTVHEGYVSREMERNGKISDRCRTNRIIKRLNAARQLLEENKREIIMHAEMQPVHKDAYESKRISEAIRRRKRAEKLDAEPSTITAANNAKALEYMAKAKKLLNIKRLIKKSKSNRLDAINKSYDLVIAAAQLGNTEAQALLINHGGGSREDWQRDWLYLTEIEKDEIRLRKAMSDDY